MAIKSKATLDDIKGSVTITGADDSRIDLAHIDFISLFNALDDLHDRADSKTLIFDLTSQPGVSPAIFNFIITATGRVWKQTLDYVVADKNLSMDLVGTTGKWRAPEVESIPALRSLLLKLFADHLIVKVAVTWP